MNDKKAIEILKCLLEKDSLDAKEKEAVRSAIGALGWFSLAEGRMKSIKKARDRRERDE